VLQGVPCESFIEETMLPGQSVVNFNPGAISLGLGNWLNLPVQGPANGTHDDATGSFRSVLQGVQFEGNRLFLLGFVRSQKILGFTGF